MAQITKTRAKACYMYDDVAYDTLREVQEAALEAWFLDRGISESGIDDLVAAIIDDAGSLRDVVKPFFPKLKRTRKPKAAAIDPPVDDPDELWPDEEDVAGEDFDDEDEELEAA